MFMTANGIGSEISENLTGEATKNINAFHKYFGEQLPEIISYGIKVVIAILLFFVGKLVIKWICKLVTKSFNRSKADAGAEQFISSLVKCVLYILLIAALITNLGVQTTSVAALLASGGVAIGLALQGSLSNFAGGVLILILKPFVVGDYIIEDSHGNEGTVKEIQIFYTKLATVDNKTIVIPNGTLSNTSLTNVTARDYRQLDLKLSISYSSDLRKAKAVIGEILDQCESLIREEEQNVFVDDLTDRAVILGIRAWVRAEAYVQTRWNLLEHIKLAFEENGIEMNPSAFFPTGQTKDGQQ